MTGTAGPQRNATRQKLRALVTGIGARGLAYGVIRSLKASRSFDVEVFGVDASPGAVGALLADRFQVVPSADDPAYPDRMRRLIAREGIDVVVPLTDTEVPVLAELASSQALPILCPPPAAVQLVSDKGRLLQLLHRRGLTPDPAFVLSSVEDLFRAADRLGYPEREVVVKPRRGSGARGVWVLSEDLAQESYLLGRPVLRRCPLSQFAEIAASVVPGMLAMPFFEGPHYTVSCLLTRDVTAILPVRRTAFEAGLTWAGELVEDRVLIGRLQLLVSALDLAPFVNVQLVWDGSRARVYEINPRLSTTSSVCSAAGLNIPDALLHHLYRRPFAVGPIDWGLRFSRCAIDLVTHERPA